MCSFRNTDCVRPTDIVGLSVESSGSTCIVRSRTAILGFFKRETLYNVGVTRFCIVKILQDLARQDFFEKCNVTFCHVDLSCWLFVAVYVISSGKLLLHVRQRTASQN